MPSLLTCFYSDRSVLIDKVKVLLLQHNVPAGWVESGIEPYPGMIGPRTGERCNAHERQGRDIRIWDNFLG